MAKATQPRVGRQGRRGSRRGRTDLHEMPRHPIIDNSEPLSTEEVGEILGVPPEHVREIKRLAVEIFDKKKNLETTR